MKLNSEEAKRLKGLSARKVTREDLAQFPGMTGWFAPVLLSKLLLRVIISDVFGQYADRRLMQAALDPADEHEHLKRAKSHNILPDKDGAVWVDYVSDLGDGFDATYAIASLLAQPVLDVEGEKLPRGALLVMGGDEVYPTALRDDYLIKTRKPYEFALPSSASPKIPLFALPGNHDWYDGLVTFLAIFCRERRTDIGGWQTVQRRSYFAARLTENWWLWGIDIALVRDMDQPQANYFTAIAAGMQQDANIILCSAEPGWYEAETSGNSYRTLSYAARIAAGAGKNLKIPLVLSGDTHHYARYHAEGAEYLTSGGGGAFLHGTHNLKPRIDADWMRSKTALELKMAYPDHETSKQLLSENRRFVRHNRGLSLTLGCLYLVCAFILSLAWQLDVGIAMYLVLLGGLYAYGHYQEGASLKLLGVSAVHSAFHMAFIVALARASLWVNEHYLEGLRVHWLLWLIGLAIPALTLGSWYGGKIFGLNLLLTCRYLNMNHNDAFSAMKLNSHRHFLRMRIVGDTLTLYPIKLETVPTRDRWRQNPDQTENPSVFIAEPKMKPEFVEAPITIRAARAPSTTEIKKPHELPPDR